MQGRALDEAKATGEKNRLARFGLLVADGRDQLVRFIEAFSERGDRAFKERFTQRHNIGHAFGRPIPQLLKNTFSCAKGQAGIESLGAGSQTGVAKQAGVDSRTCQSADLPIAEEIEDLCHDRLGCNVFERCAGGNGANLNTKAAGSTLPGKLIDYVLRIQHIVSCDAWEMDSGPVASTIR